MKRQRKEREIFSAGPKSRSKVWDLYRDGITVSGLRLFRTCREQFRLKYAEGWSSKTVSSAADFGNCFHAVLEHVHKFQSEIRKQTKVGATDYAIKHQIQIAVRNFKRNRINEGLLKHEQAKLDLLCVQCEVVAEFYFRFWSEQDKTTDWFGKEIEFRFSTPELLDMPIVGKIDGVMIQLPKVGTKKRKSVEKKRLAACFTGKQADFPNFYRIHEVKTKGDIDEEGISSFVTLDIQTMIYALAFRACTGIEPIGTCYDVIRRPGIRLCKNETLKAHAERLAGLIKTNPKRFFYRWNVDFAAGDLDRYAKNQVRRQLRQLQLWNHGFVEYKTTKIKTIDPRDRGSKVTQATGRMLENPWDNPKHYLNEDALYGRGGRSEFFEAIARNNFYKLFRRKVAHRELSAKPTLTNAK